MHVLYLEIPITIIAYQMISKSNHDAFLSASLQQQLLHTSGFERALKPTAFCGAWCSLALFSMVQVALYFL